MASTESGSRGGMLREMRLTLTELFTGGKLPPERELTLEVLFGLLGYLSNIDSIVTDHEVTLINGLMDELELPIQARHRALDAIERGRKRQVELGDELKRYLAVYPVGSAEVRFVYDSMLKLAAADGRIRPREREFLQELTVRLGYPEKALEPKLQALLKSAAA
jgi:hypothetical protein